MKDVDPEGDEFLSTRIIRISYPHASFYQHVGAVCSQVLTQNKSPGKMYNRSVHSMFSRKALMVTKKCNQD